MEVARRYLRGQTQCEIGEVLGKNHSTICRDLKVLQKRWRDAANLDVGRWLAEQLAKIDQVERAAWEGWERSLKREITISEKREGENKGDESRALIRRESRDGNPAFLETVFRCIERRCKLLGLEPPSKAEYSGPDGGPITYAIDFTSLSDEQLRELALDLARESREVVEAAERITAGTPAAGGAQE